MKKSVAPAVVVLALVLAGCGGEAQSDSNADTGIDRVITPVEGCGEGSFTDRERNTVETLARCEEHAPAPIALPESETLVIGASSWVGTNTLPVLVGDDKGEFEKENLQLELKTLSPADGLGLLAQGDIDVQIASLSAGFFNMVDAGFDINLAYPAGWTSPDSKVGIWAKGTDFRAGDLEDATIGTQSGPGSFFAYSFGAQLEEVGLNWKDLRLELLPTGDGPVALRNGSVDAAYVDSPQWLEMEKDGNYTFLMPGMREGEPLVGVFFGPSMSAEKRDAAVAFTRAYIRTVNTYLRTPDYTKDPEFCSYVADLVDTDPELYCSVPGLAFDYEMKNGLMEGIQEAFLEDGSLSYDQVRPQSELEDYSFVEEAIGHEYVR